MPNKLPETGQWYHHKDKGPLFYVTGIDPLANTVEVQHFDGDIEEYTFNEWSNLEIEPGEQPENWSGALDIAECDDLGTEITDTRAQDWEEPAQELPRVSEESEAGGGDDYAEGFMEEEPLETADVEAGIFNVSPDTLTRRPDGVLEEDLSDTWYAEYTEDPASGLWRVDVYKLDVPEWHDIEFESLDDAMQAARDYYVQF